jgi:hypothetical protein
MVGVLPLNLLNSFCWQWEHLAGLLAAGPSRRREGPEISRLRRCMSRDITLGPRNYPIAI